LLFSPEKMQSSDMRPKPTILDVARKAGVSGKTVSRVVNGDPHVGDRTQERVTAAITQLGYRPNLAAASLRSKRSFVIAAISAQGAGEFHHSAYAHLSAACSKRGHHLVIEQIDVTARPDLEQLRGLLDTVGPAGIVLMPGAGASVEVMDLIRDYGTRTVVFGTADGPADAHKVCAEEVGGGAEVADHLWALGHRRFAILRTPFQTSLPRGQALEARLLALGADPAMIMLVDLDTALPALENGRLAALGALAAASPPTAIFTFTDLIAAGVIAALATRGAAVPGDFSVVGCDDGEVARAIFPALTTLRQPLAEMADAAIDLLVGSGAVPQVVSCPMTLVVRDSTASAQP
jgi:LacI family transcriptional regulator